MSDHGIQMKGEDRSHRDLILNPRRWPLGTNSVPVSNFRLETKRISQLSGEERDLLYHLVYTGLPGDVANLGHAQGGSAVLFAKAMVSRGCVNVVESVDLFPTPRDWRRARQTLVDFGVRNIVNPRRGYTQGWGEKFTVEGRKFSGIFIDACHTYESVVADCNTWRPLTSIGAWVAFHDTHQEFSHCAIEDTIVKDPNFVEVNELHVYSTRTFRRIA